MILPSLASPAESLSSNKFVQGNMILVNPWKPKSCFYLLFCNHNIRKLTPPHSTQHHQNAQHCCTDPLTWKKYAKTSQSNWWKVDNGAERHRGNILLVSFKWKIRQEQMLYLIRNRSFILPFCSNKDSPLFLSSHKLNRAWRVKMCLARVYFKNWDFLIFPHLWTPSVPPDV